MEKKKNDNVINIRRLLNANEKKFTKEDLRTGDIVVTKEEGNAIIIGNRIKRFEIGYTTRVVNKLIIDLQK